MSDAQTWLVVGLGNPGARYARTRHNIGFMAVERWVSDLSSGVPSWQDKWKGLTTTVTSGRQRCVVLRPQTYMNRSGGSVVPAAQFHRVLPPQIVVVHDEIDFPPGRLAIKKGGGHGGHNGLRDIVAQLGSADFLRIRLGVGRPVHGEVADYVLSEFAADERDQAEELAGRAAAALTCMMTDGVVMAMNKFNT